MALEFTLPDVGEGVAEGEIVQWLVGPGDTVTEDQPLVEVETDKAVVEVPSPVDGTVRELRVEAGDVVPVGDVLIVLEPDGDVEDLAADVGSDSADAESGGGTEETTTEEGGRVFAAPSARRLARELGVDIATVEGSGPGGRVTEADVRAVADTADGPSEDGEQPATAVGGPETDGVAGGSETTSADETETAPETTGAGETEVASEPGAPAEAREAEGGAGSGGRTAADRDRTLAVPATRRVAEEEGVDIDAVPATEQRDGEAFVTAEAVREYAQAQQAAQAADAETVTAETATGAGEPAVAAGEEERVPYRGVRRSIGEQMEQSAYTAPHVTHHDTVDVTALVEARADLKARAEERGIALSYLPFVVKAVVAALREYPILNSQLDEEAGEIVKKGYYNIGIATATEAGLMVPVVRDAGEKSLLGIASEANELVERARNRSIAPKEMQGGTFTITNFGAIGGEYATPIINYPETAILGLGAIKKRPWVVDDGEDGRTDDAGVSGEVVPRHVMTLSLSIDHRVIDGAEAAQFTNTLKEYLQEPTLLLLD